MDDFGLDWRRVRSVARKAIAAHIAPVFEAAAEGGLDSAVWDATLRAALADLKSWRAAGNQVAGEAISLLGDAAILRDAIVGAGPALVSDAAARVRGAVLSRSLGRMRAAMAGEDGYQRQIWNRVDRISRALDARQGFAGGRCDIAHWKALAEQIREDYPDDHKLPRSIRGLAELFHNFCAECAQTWEFIDEDSIDAEEVSDMPDIALLDYHLDGCVDVLGEPARTYVQIHYRLGDVIQLSSAAWCRANDVENTRFHRALAKARLALRDCLERAVGDAVENRKGPKQ